MTEESVRSEQERQAALEKQQQRMRADAEARLATNLAKYSSASETRDVSIVIPREPVVRATVPVVVPPAATSFKPVTVEKKRKVDDSPDQLKSILLGSQWSSRGKPASLLPSVTTSCKGGAEAINCSSKPKNVTTKYGQAVYKVEAKLTNFAHSGEFKLGYRTLVMLIDDPTSIANGLPGSDDERWQITEKSMGCKLSRQEGNVRCKDNNGVTRSYQMSGAISLQTP